MLIGRIIGRTSPERFSFEVSGIVKKMDFIAVRDPERHWVLGRIDGITQDGSRAVAKVSVSGYVDKEGIVRAPKMPFQPGSYVYKADDSIIKRVLNLKQSGLYIGLLDGSENLKVHMNPKKLMTKHLAVLAKSGYGKSYLISVILEEFMENKIPAVIIDPHGEYTTLQNPNENKDEIKYMQRFGITPKGYRKAINMFSLEKNLTEGVKKLSFNGKLSHDELFDMLPFKLTAAQMGIIYSAVQDLGKETYTLDEIEKAVRMSTSRARWSVVSVLDYLRSTGLLSSVNFIKPEDLVKKNKLSVVNLRGIDPDLQQLVVYKLVKELFEARKFNKVPPFLLVVEEAHNFCPERGFGEAISSGIMRTVASEGRKFGLGVAIISQRAARVDKNVLSQCTTQVFLRINNPNDLRAVVESMEGVTSGVASQLKSLPIGTGIVVGVIDQPLIVNVRIKRSNHGGAALAIPKKAAKILEGDTLYFYPKFLEEDMRKNIRKRLEQFKMVYYPLWRLQCRFDTEEGEKIDNLFIDGLSGELIFNRDDRLARTFGLPKLINLDMKSKAVLLFLTTYGMSTVEDMSQKLKINNTDVETILANLKRRSLVSREGKNWESDLNLNFEDVIEHQMLEEAVNQKRRGDLIPFKVTKSSTNKVLDLFAPKAVERKKCYYPYWFIFYEDGDVDIIDALTGEKDKHLMDEDVLEKLPL